MVLIATVRGRVRGFAAVAVMLVFFAAVAAVFASIASASTAAVSALIGLALIGTVYVATGGRAWFGTRERPERIIGARLRFSDVEGYPHPSCSVAATIGRAMGSLRWFATFESERGGSTPALPFSTDGERHRPAVIRAFLRVPRGRPMLSVRR